MGGHLADVEGPSVELGSLVGAWVVERNLGDGGRASLMSLEGERRR